MPQSQQDAIVSFSLKSPLSGTAACGRTPPCRLAFRSSSSAGRGDAPRNHLQFGTAAKDPGILTIMWQCTNFVTGGLQAGLQKPPRQVRSAAEIRQRGQEPVECIECRNIGDAVDPGLAKMALEGGNRPLRPLANNACHFNSVAIERQHRLNRFDWLALIALLEKSSAADRGRRNPVADAPRMERFPGKFFSRIHLANGSHIAVRKHPFRGDRPAIATVPTQFGDRFDLRRGKSGRPPG